MGEISVVTEKETFLETAATAPSGARIPVEVRIAGCPTVDEALGEQGSFAVEPTADPMEGVR